jgi:hypothetical protein
MRGGSLKNWNSSVGWKIIVPCPSAYVNPGVDRESEKSRNEAQVVAGRTCVDVSILQVQPRLPIQQAEETRFGTYAVTNMVSQDAKRKDYAR